MPARQPGGARPSQQFGSEMPRRETPGGGMPQRGEMPRRGDMPGDGQPAAPEAFPHRQRGAARPPRPAGRHRRPVPASLPDSAPALVLAVPGAYANLTGGVVGDLAAVLRVDNPAVDVRVARVDDAAPGDTDGLHAVITQASAMRPDSQVSSVVIPLVASPHPLVNRKVHETVAAAGVNAVISGFINSNAAIAEALHIRLAESGLARADRVRLFSIVTAADGIIIATVGGPESAVAANVTSVLLAARLALPVLTASLDSPPAIGEAAVRMKEMGVNRLAIAPCFIGPEATQSDIDALSIGAECAAPIGSHSNIAKLAAVTYGQAISQMQFPGEEPPAE